MEKIPLPTSLTIEEGDTPNTATLTIEPCFPGYGTTLGNAIRRNLLLALPGAAVISFKIKGAQHEFSGIQNIKEDIVEISLNLKMLRVKVFNDQPVKIILKASGEKKVTAKDFEPNSDVEIVNKDLHIATLTDKKAGFEMEVIVKQGRGYVPTEAREKEEVETGMIRIDSNFSPIEKVGFKVENVRVGQMTNWDKLVVNIQTDGSITPKTAVHNAVVGILEHFTFIEEKTLAVAGEEAPKPTEEPKKKRKSKKSEITEETVAEEK